MNGPIETRRPNDKPSSLMAAPRVHAQGPSAYGSVESWLFAEAYAFDFFQAVRLLEKIYPERRAVGSAAAPAQEVARFRALVSLSFPPSSIYDLERPSAEHPVPVMTVAFMGLTGPSGILPRHYTEMLLRQEKESKSAEKHALRDWIDQFNHRFLALFYRAWEKYRFYLHYERGEYARTQPDAFTRGLLSLIGLGMPSLRQRLRVSAWLDDDGGARQKVLARIDDMALLYYGGSLARRPRCALGLAALIQDYFQLPVHVLQFQGQWLALAADDQSRLGVGGNQLGVNAVAGERVWDVQSKFRVRLGPLPFDRFQEFLPDRSPMSPRKTFFLLTHLVRLYAGPEFDFDVQLVLRADETPECRLADGGLGARLGWNTWVRSLPLPRDSDDAVFAGEDLVWLNPRASHTSSANA